MIKKLVTRLDLKGLDAVMLVAGLIGGLAGSFLAVRASEHRVNQVENAVISAAAEHHEAPEIASAFVDAGAPEPHGPAEHAEAEK
jgi:hypothetical protein